MSTPAEPQLPPERQSPRRPRRLAVLYGFGAIAVAGAAALLLVVNVIHRDAQVDPQKAAVSAARESLDRQHRVSQAEAAAEVLNTLASAVNEIDAVTSVSPPGPPRPLESHTKAKLEAALAAAATSAASFNYVTPKDVECVIRELMGDQYLRVGDYEGALRSYSQAGFHYGHANRTQTDEYLQLLTKNAEVCLQAKKLEQLRGFYSQIHQYHVARYGPEDPSTQATEMAYAVSLLGGGYGETRDCVELLRAIHTRRKAKLGATHRDTLAALNRLCDAMIRWNPQQSLSPQLIYVNLTQSQFAANDPDAIAAEVRLGDTYSGQIQKLAAQPHYRRAVAQSKLAFGPDDERTLTCLEKASACLLGVILDGHPSRISNGWENLEAILYLEHVLAARTRLYGDDDPRTLKSLSAMAAGYSSAKRQNDAVRIETLKLARSTEAFGDDDPATWRDALATAEKLSYARRYDEAIACVEKVAVATRKSARVERTYHLKNSLTELSRLYRDRGRSSDAVRVQKELVELVAGEAGDKDRELMRELDALADAYIQTKQTDLALGTYQRVELMIRTRAKKVAGIEDETKGLLYQNKVNLIRLYLGQSVKRPDLAVAMAKECYATYAVAERRKAPAAYYWSGIPGNVLKDHYEVTKDYLELIKILKDDVEHYSAGDSLDNRRTVATAREKLLTAYKKAGMHSEADELRRVIVDAEP